MSAQCAMLTVMLLCFVSDEQSEKQQQASAGWLAWKTKAHSLQSFALLTCCCLVVMTPRRKQEDAFSHCDNDRQPRTQTEDYTDLWGWWQVSAPPPRIGLTLQRSRVRHRCDLRADGSSWIMSTKFEQVTLLIWRLIDKYTFISSVTDEINCSFGFFFITSLSYLCFFKLLVLYHDKKKD